MKEKAKEIEAERKARVKQKIEAVKKVSAKQKKDVVPKKKKAILKRNQTIDISSSVEPSEDIVVVQVDAMKIPKKRKLARRKPPKYFMKYYPCILIMLNPRDSNTIQYFLRVSGISMITLFSWICGLLI